MAYSAEFRDKLLVPDINERLRALELLASLNPDDLHSLFTDLLPRYGPLDPFAGEVLQELAQHLDIRAIERTIQRCWPQLPDHVRLHIAAELSFIGIADCHLLHLAHDPASTTRVKHFLASGYYQCIRYGLNRQTLHQLLDAIGRYENPRRDAILARFIANARADYPLNPQTRPPAPPET